VVKPRTGSGSRNVSLIASSEVLARAQAPARADATAQAPARAGATAHATTADFVVQEYLPGAEYSVDVLADASGRVIASVPRVRERIDSGVSVAGRTMHDAELERLGAAVVTLAGLTYVANVQFRRDAAGRAALLEVNPRAPGTLALTVASGVDMPRLALDSLRGMPLPASAGFREVAMVRYLEERFVELDEIQQVNHQGRAA
jgi:carbamoyl-phosphate synthase large subunit